MFPRGAYSAGNGLPGSKFPSSTSLMSAQVASSIDGLQEVMTSDSNDYSVAEGQAFVASFSQSGSMAFAVGYRSRTLAQPDFNSIASCTSPKTTWGR